LILHLASSKHINCISVQNLHFWDALLHELQNIKHALMPSGKVGLKDH